MLYKNLLVFSALCAAVVIGSLACHKHNDAPPTPDLPGPGQYKTPQLPSPAYDYSKANMPAYIAEYLRLNPQIDNTPADNPLTNEGAALGRVLFYDKLLSFNNTISCSSCHHQETAFTDAKSFSNGFNGGFTKRNAMSTVNLRYFKAGKMFWDLRAPTLEAQVLMPIQDHVEMGITSLTGLVAKLSQVSYYPALFKNAFGSPDITSDKIARAIAQFMRSITSFDSRYDQGLSSNFSTFTPQENRGFAMVKRAFCLECHSDLTHVASGTSPSFLVVENSGQNTGNGSNNGLEADYTDKGIGAISGKQSDMGTFKIPTLRNIELTAPYMHDGRFSTLEQVLDHYSNGVQHNPNRGVQIPEGGFHFTDQEKADIISFLKTLTDRSLISDPRFSDPFK